MKQDEEGKIFVGGLNRDTSAEGMRMYFSRFGEVIESSVLYDKMSSLSRGFGFVKFKDPSCVETVLKAQPHFLDNKKIDPKPCTPREVQQQKKEAENVHISKYKIFVGGLTSDMTVDEVRKYFETFGPTAEVVFALDKDEGRNKGFGFVTFKKESSATDAVKQRYHYIGEKKVEAKKAEPRDKMKSISQTVTKNAGDSRMQQSMNYMPQPGYYYEQQPYYPMVNYGMGYGGGGMGPSGGYMPNDGYGTYGHFKSSGYGSSTTMYSDMGSYKSPTYSSSKAPSRPTNDSKSYHPYKR